MKRAIFGALCALLLAAPASAQQSVADFYRGKSIDLYIGFPAGGGYDLYARLIGKHLEKHLPGNPTVVPKQMLGAGSQKAAAYVYQVAPRDGTVLGTADQSIVLQQALGELASEIDNTKLHWIGNANTDNNVVVMWHSSGVKTVEDAKKRQFAIAASGNNTSAQFPQVLNTLVGTKFKIISGYQGGSDMDLAMERGEVDGRGSNAWASYKATKPDWLRDNKINVIVQVGLSKAPDLPNVPLLMDLASTAEDRAALKMLSTPTAIGRPIFTTPDVPKDRVTALRRAFDAIMKDPAFIADIQKANLDLNPMPGEELQKVVEELVNTPKPIAQRLLKAIEGRDIVERKQEKGAKK